MINYFLGAALCAVPFFLIHGPKTAPTLSQEYLFSSLTMFGVLFLGIKEVHKNLKIIAVALFALAFIPSDIFGLYQNYQLYLCGIGSAFISLIYSHRKEIDLKLVYNILGCLCVAESLFLVLLYCGIDPFGEVFTLLGYKYAIIHPIVAVRFASGSLGNINHSAALIACTLPFLRPIFWPLPIIILLVSNSTMPVICALIGIVALYSYTLKNYKLLIAGFTALVVAASALLLNLIPHGHYLSDNHRVNAWKTLFKDIDFQLYGKGFGYVPSNFSKKLVDGEKFYQMHNEWVELYAIGGLLAVVAGVYLILPVFKNRGNPAINACLIALLVNSLGNFTFHIAPLFMVFGTCYALQLAKD